MVGSKNWAAEPPARLAWAMARSAWRIRVSGSAPSCGKTATPTDTPRKTWWPEISKGRRMASTSLLATRAASALSWMAGRRTVNSSPPRRATMEGSSMPMAMSQPRVTSDRRRPTISRRRSPSPMPRLSLTRLKRSRSRKSTAPEDPSSSALRATRSVSLRKRSRLGSSVTMST